ncbi:HEAT repeat domain-containing protein [Aggregicoccus sp. 17bor-14]|uniref:HEAT repeat domain-containing protein n=1 Tax=Myxococcaceae TaxID=31 RepID=UPI00129C756D|nr:MULTISPECIES: HEAT repeat domain-containing protein [Myxococcaceae]MBF5041057.1 HEAT repeat domain-containing protein [Simulacricoccus sp. 17bor-14]MRI86843.1 HEAT repeat domain-containing protein [Aggregicoccus sp. 17bor-14]
MGFFDIFGGSGPEKALKLKSKVTQKYGDPTTRQKALQQLGEMKFPEAVSVLMSRFTVTVEPLTTDADEKEHTFELIKGFGQDAVAPVKEFLRKSDQATSWALRVLTALLPEAEVTAILLELLGQLGSQYTRTPEKKVVLLHALEGREDARIAPATLPFLEDMADDVKLAALAALGPRKYEPAREPILRLLTAEETARRVQMAALAALHQSGFGVQGFREKVQAVVQEPFFLDASGNVQRRA